MRPILHNAVPVTFVSSWSEGEVRTRAKLEPLTGRVFDIGVADVGEGFEHLLEEYVESQDGSVQCVVQYRTDCDSYFLDEPRHALHFVASGS